MAGKACSVCLHQNVQAIDLAIGAGAAARTIASQNAPLHYSAILRHAKRCKLHQPTQVERKLLAAKRTQVERGSVALFESEVSSAVELARLSERVAKLVADRAIEESDGGVLCGDALTETLAAIKGAVEARGGGLRVWAETMAKLTGELQTGAKVQVNVMQVEGTAELLDLLSRVLAPFPEASAAVGAALEPFAARFTAGGR